MLSRDYSVTPYMVMFAAWATLLSRLSGQKEVLIGTPVANRQSTEAERMIGLFINTLALRADLRDNPTVSDLLKRVRSMMLAAWNHQEIPFEQIVHRVRPARRMSHNPLFQVLFVVQNTPQREVNVAQLAIERVTEPVNSAPFDLSLSMQETNDAIIGNLNYATDLFERSTMERWVEHLKGVFEAMVRDPRGRIEELPLE
jgi:non-ribosomal peptide synthetase component F